jgi:2-polyprenyl-6-methoxyphenol hydroxylase-like FAD-dependent oxidoreductase
LAPAGRWWATPAITGTSSPRRAFNDAFRDAERLAAALDEALGGARPYDEALADYHRDRDSQVLPMYEMTCQLATLEPPPADMQQLLGAIAGNQAAMDAFVRMNAGTISPAVFMAPENVAAMLGQTAGPGR